MVIECFDGGFNYKELLKVVKKVIGKKGKIVMCELVFVELNFDNECIIDGECWFYYYLVFVVMLYLVNFFFFFIINFNYLYYLIVCCNCFMYLDVVCGNCGCGVEY